MPSRGLPSVVQPFDSDWSAYIAHTGEGILITKEARAQIELVNKSIT